MQIGNFKFSVIELEFESVERDYKFYGSYYRGMLGRNLKRRFCVLRDMECKECPLNDKCLYMLSFEKYKDILFPPYIINRGERDHLRLTVVGSFCDFAEMYLQAFRNTLNVKEGGFYNPFYDTFSKSKVVVNSMGLNDIEFNDIDKLKLSLSFVRLKKNSQMIDCNEISLKHILNAIEKRIYLTNKYYGDAAKKVYLPDVEIDSKILECKYFQVKRYSNRKKREMRIPSVNIRMELFGELKKLYPYLYLASFLNIGTNASMGFGEINIMEAD